MNALPAPLSSAVAIDWELTLSTIVVPLAINILIAAIVLLVTVIVADKLKASVKKSLTLTRADAATTLLLCRMTQIGVLVAGLIVVLGIFGIDPTALVAVVGVVSLAISLSIQDVLKCFVAGVYLLIERPFRIGERVKLKDFTGDVEHVGIRTTVLRTDEGFLVLVPNSIIFAEVLVNKGLPKGSAAAAVDREEPALNPHP